jgi:hypothetical protein
MQPIVYKSPFNKKYAISINNFTIDNPSKIKENDVLDYSIFYPSKTIPKKLDIKANLNEYNYFKKVFNK